MTDAYRLRWSEDDGGRFFLGGEPVHCGDRLYLANWDSTEHARIAVRFEIALREEGFEPVPVMIFRDGKRRRIETGTGHDWLAWSAQP